MQKLLLIDDDAELGELLSQYFSGFNLLLESTTHPSEGLAKLDSKSFDLLILDVMLPEMDGFEVCKQVRKKNDIPIIMLTARGEVMDRIVGLELGADDYLPKPFEPRELVARIQGILKRRQISAIAGAQLAFGKLVVDTVACQATLAGELLSLSTMEYQLLELLAQSPKQTFSRDDILNALKGIDADVYSRSVDILVSRLRQKLKPLDLIKTVRGRGYIFTGQKNL